MNDCTVEH